MSDPAKNLIEFVGQFCELLEGHLKSVEMMMGETTEQVMKNITSLSNISEKNKGEADEDLFNSHINPDSETQALVDSIQDIVTDIFEEASEKLNKGESLDDMSFSDPVNNDAALIHKTKKFCETFQTKMNKLDSLDSEIKNILFEVMGSMSAHDNMAQGLNHIVIGLHSLQVSLSYILIDFEFRGKLDKVSEIQNDLKAHIFRDYTMEEEKDWFKKVFPDFQLKKAS